MAVIETRTVFEILDKFYVKEYVKGLEDLANAAAPFDFYPRLNCRCPACLHKYHTPLTFFEKHIRTRYDNVREYLGIKIIEFGRWVEDD